MAEMMIRPTMKFIYLGYAVVVVIIIVWIGALLHLEWSPTIPSIWQYGITWLPLLLLLWPARCHLRRHFTKLTILDDLLRYERGFLGKTTRTILISHVQDVTVRQSLGQRIFGVGDLSLETAGKSSWEAFVDFDRPQEIADHINQHAKRELPIDPNA